MAERAQQEKTVAAQALHYRDCQEEEARVGRKALPTASLRIGSVHTQFAVGIEPEVKGFPTACSATMRVLSGYSLLQQHLQSRNSRSIPR